MTSKSELNIAFSNINDRNLYIRKYMDLSQINFSKNDTTGEYALKINRNIANIQTLFGVVGKTYYQSGLYNNAYDDEDEFHIILTAMQSHQKIIEESYTKLVRSLSEDDAKLLFNAENNDLISIMNNCQEHLIRATKAKLFSEELWAKYLQKN